MARVEKAVQVDQVKTDLSLFLLIHIKRIAHFEIIFWYVLAYLKGIQDVGVFVSAAVSILIFFWSNCSCLSVI